MGWARLFQCHLGYLNNIYRPSGNRSQHLYKAKAEKGEFFAGLATTLHPAVSAAAIFRPSIARGKSHGLLERRPRFPLHYI